MKKILIVDDSNFMRRSLTRILTDHGYSVIAEAENGKIGLQRYKELAPDAVTMDVTMKEMTGLEALKAIIKHDRNAKVIMVSSMGQAPIVKEAIALGAKGFLLKPFEESLVISTLEKLLR